MATLDSCRQNVLSLVVLFRKQLTEMPNRAHPGDVAASMISDNAPGQVPAMIGLTLLLDSGVVECEDGVY